jgi:hypothetical protein
MATTEDPTVPALIGHAAIAAAALERAIDQRIAACLPALSTEHHTIILSRLTFRQRLDILHELALGLVDESERAAVTTWRRRLAKLWASNTRMLARDRLATGIADETKARGVIRRLITEETRLQTFPTPVIPAQAGTQGLVADRCLRR